ncbi:MAG: N-acetylmuramoyl-L-alanine amidase [Elusimicrobia bacterium]|nr:N-acetylmuramoyl-L-alanine amidase [Elusimicrobiota bacterium]
MFYRLFLIPFFFFVFAPAAAPVFAQKTYGIEILENGLPLGEAQMLLRNGFGYLRTSDVANIFSLEADWLPKKKCIRLKNAKNESIRLFLKSKKIYIKKRLCSLKKEPFFSNGRSWIPLELLLTKSFQGFVSSKVKWNFSKKTLEIGNGKQAAFAKKRSPEIRAMPKYKKIKRRVRTIVIDPGHGGKDPGAVAIDGTKEKNIVLDIGFRLYKLLRKDPSFNAILTRKADIFLPLATRTLIANRAKADLFVSVHANASFRKQARGFEVYFLSDRASDSAAQAVANTENAVVEMEEPGHYKTDINSILWSMKLNEFMNESAEACGFLKTSMADIFGKNHCRIKQAGFYVLKGARMPAILVETAFLTNKKDRRMLKKRKYRQLIAEKIYEAIKKYKNWSEK